MVDVAAKQRDNMHGNRKSGCGTNSRVSCTISM
jgi:hypothetical protein